MRPACDHPECTAAYRCDGLRRAVGLPPVTAAEELLRLRAAVYSTPTSRAHRSPAG
jgi:hypothetical protein